MALTKYGFIVTGDNFVQAQGTEKFFMKVVGVSSPSEGADVAKAMVAEGIQLIELCGGFNPEWAQTISKAIEFKIPVGVVATYEPKSADLLSAIFAD